MIKRKTVQPLTAQIRCVCLEILSHHHTLRYAICDMHTGWYYVTRQALAHIYIWIYRNWGQILAKVLHAMRNNLAHLICYKPKMDDAMCESNWKLAWDLPMSTESRIFFIMTQYAKYDPYSLSNSLERVKLTMQNEYVTWRESHSISIIFLLYFSFINMFHVPSRRVTGVYSIQVYNIQT